ncbi:hypothetical protein BKA65DRAFT_547876 [Rhexocercosporidium sp. MPI-PUGE-AT-0058]|nr:hypothetical protein BKA65DRAFT_547876 [Rhexocercosporidium sp. MPI-PUGE-AT-0058]
MSPFPFDRWMHEYEQLFLDVILPAVYSNTKSISYIPSSTTNGYLRFNFSFPIPMVQRYENITPGYIYGDTYHYDYDTTVAFDLSSYPVGRFANEFGFHSMPSIQTWQQAINPEYLHFSCTTIILRNHHSSPGGFSTSITPQSLQVMGQMTAGVQQYYPAPQLSHSIANFSAWCQTTQIFQADFYRSQITYYHIWQAPTWAGIEHDGRWKYLHYVAKDIYQPVIIASYWNYTTGDLTAYVTSGLWDTVAGTSTLAWYGYNGSALDKATDVPFTVGALNTTQVLHTNTHTIPYDLKNSFLKMNITATDKLPNTNETKTFKHEYIFHDLDLSTVALADPGLTLSYSYVTGNFTIEATKGVAAWVWLDMPAGTLGNFESNAFWLLPGDGKREVGVRIKNDTSNGRWVECVAVRSLWDNTTD